MPTDQTHYITIAIISKEKLFFLISDPVFKLFLKLKYI